MRSLSVAVASAVMIVFAMVLVASQSASLAQDPEDPAPTPDETFAAIRGWPGARPGQNPAGLYSWFEGSRGWMHRVPTGWTDAAPNSVELRFVSGSPQGPDIPELESSAVDRSWWDDRVFGEPVPVLDVRTQVWLLDVDGRRVAILLDSFPNTDPALVAEAEAIVESIRVEPADHSSGYRLVFELPSGWDSG